MANLVHWLACDEARYATGQLLGARQWTLHPDSADEVLTRAKPDRQSSTASNAIEVSAGAETAAEERIVDALLAGLAQSGIRVINRLNQDQMWMR